MKKWLNTATFTWIMLIFLTPIGIWLLWRNKFYTKKTNSILTTIFALFFIISIANLDYSTPNTSIATNTTTESTKTKSTVSHTAKQNQTIATASPSKSVTKTVKPKPSHKFIVATVTEVIDGDTIKINLKGKEEKVRLILVDTPETKHPNKPIQPFGKEASQFTKDQLEGKEIEIEPGVQERDKYGRLLAYVYLNSKMFNKTLIEKGLARVTIYPPNTKYLDEFKSIETEAKKKGIGIWSIENYVHEDGYYTQHKPISNNSNHNQTSKASNSFQNNPSDDKESNISCKGKIKGNANSKIYHVPGGAYYEKTVDNIVWFCSVEDAEAHGYRASKR